MLILSRAASGSQTVMLPTAPPNPSRPRLDLHRSPQKFTRTRPWSPCACAWKLLQAHCSGVFTDRRFTGLRWIHPNFTRLHFAHTLKSNNRFYHTCSSQPSAHRSNWVGKRFLSTICAKLCITIFITSDGSPFSGSRINR